MKPGYFIEILSRTGEVLHRHQVADLPICIGRAYDNDFILDDVHTAAHHAIVEATEDGKILLRDLGSKNGLVHLGKRQSQVLVDGHSVVRLGQTSLRIRTTDFAVEEEAFDTNNYDWEGWPPALTGILMICLMAFSSIWVGETDKFAPVRYLMAMLGILDIRQPAFFWARAFWPTCLYCRIWHAGIGNFGPPKWYRGICIFVGSPESLWQPHFYRLWCHDGVFPLDDDQATGHASRHGDGAQPVNSGFWSHAHDKLSALGQLDGRIVYARDVFAVTSRESES
jgi:pSer/pThr/pTyr-binding forkhead associated (FHA) protein